MGEVRLDAICGVSDRLEPNPGVYPLLPGFYWVQWCHWMRRRREPLDSSAEPLISFLAPFFGWLCIWIVLPTPPLDPLLPPLRLSLRAWEISHRGVLSKSPSSNFSASGTVQLGSSDQDPKCHMNTDHCRRVLRSTRLNIDVLQLSPTNYTSLCFSLLRPSASERLINPFPLAYF
jgi:hypothetical protein